MCFLWFLVMSAGCLNSPVIGARPYFPTSIVCTASAPPSCLMRSRRQGRSCASALSRAITSGVSGRISVLSGADIDMRPETVGRVLPYVQLQIVDETRPSAPGRHSGNDSSALTWHGADDQRWYDANLWRSHQGGLGLSRRHWCSRRCRLFAPSWSRIRPHHPWRLQCASCRGRKCSCRTCGGERSRRGGIHQAARRRGNCCLRCTFGQSNGSRVDRALPRPPEPG